MNATIQCLSNTPALRAFFAGTREAPRFLSEISTSPLSMDGKLAREFSHVLRQMWCNKNKSVTPAGLKKLIGQKRAEFSGYQQQDAHELLSFLLDGLHEDVNRAPYPPPKEEEEDFTGKPDEEVSKLRWNAHLRRNDSKIVDLFQFQIRSELECPECGNVSVTFDPIMYLSLPMPKPPHSVSITVVPLNFPTTPMCTVNIEIPNTATFEELEARLSAIVDGSSQATTRYAFADVFSDRVFRQFEKRDRMSDIRIADKVYAMEVKLAPQTIESSHTFVPVVFRRQVRPTYSYVSNQQWQYEKCAPPRIVSVAEGATNHEVYTQLSAMASSMMARSSAGSKRAFAIMTNVDTYASKSGEDLMDDDRKFEPTEQVGVNFLDAEGAQLMKDSFPSIVKHAASGDAPGGTTLIQCLEKNAEREQLSDIDSAYCGKCKTHQRQFKRLDIWTLPQILIVHLKRFGHDAMDGPLEKIEGPIEFPMQLDMHDFLCRPDKLPSTVFDLHGVVNHHGNLGGGHYTAHALVTPADDQGTSVAEGEWFCFDDSCADITNPTFDKEAAYMLFYRRR